MPEPEVRSVVETKLVEMDLKPFENKLAGRLSGGNKRKLGVANALVGDPPIIFLDEPSTGMDPVARRFMWSVIARVATERKQCSIILTTHNTLPHYLSARGEAVWEEEGALGCMGGAAHPLDPPPLLTPLAHTRSPDPGARRPA